MTMRTKYYKTAQRLFFNLFIEKWIFAILLVGTILFMLSIIHFGETAMQWSREKYSVIFSNFKDNLKDHSFHAELSQVVPVDVVYTWVNGSDPKFLKDLKEVKEGLELADNVTNPQCSAPACVPSHLVVVGCGAETVRVEYVKDQNADMGGLEEIRTIRSRTENITVFVFSNSDQTDRIRNKSQVQIGTHHYALSLTHWTTDWTVPHSVPMELFVVATQVPSHVSTHGLEQALLSNFNLSARHTWLYLNDSLAVLELKNVVDARNLISRELSLENEKIISFHEAFLILKLPDMMEDDRISALRFSDNEELRYSLRSVEKYAPWVRHVFLVTNGQIPHWLNVDCPKLTVVTHRDIFRNSSALPTFSSPAIETNLHRIPGLSSKFLYFNDDVFLGAPVWPDDFLTPQGGSKIFLSWALPDCSKGCPASWQGDGYCDVRCNTTQCLYDGGDCVGVVSEDLTMPYGLDWTESPPRQDLCSNHCQDQWIGDQVCDNSCDTEECGYDGGDCGREEVTRVLIRLEAPRDTTNTYTLPSPHLAAYWDLAGMHGSLTLERGGGGCEGGRSISYHREEALLVVVVRNNTEGLCTFNISRLVGDVEKKQVMKVFWKAKQSKPLNLMEKIKEMKESNFKKRKLLDAFGDSLLYVNNLYNKEYGYVQRKVPAHMPHMLDVNILKEMEKKYETSWAKTGSQKLRSPTDMQYSFAYFHYLMQEKTQRTVEQIFDSFDTDSSGTLSDREIRTILTRIFPLPLSYKNVQEFESEILKCSENLTKDVIAATPPNERYYHSKLPVVTKELISNCREISNAFKVHFSQRSLFPHEVVRHPDVAFRQLTSNLSMVVGMLDTLRKWPRKFYCINDNTDPARVEDNEVVRAVLEDFFHSVLPTPSMFELDSRFRNRYLHISELRQWLVLRSALSCLSRVCVGVLLLLLILHYCQPRVARQGGRVNTV